MMSSSSVPAQAGDIKTYSRNGSPRKTFFTTPNPFEKQFGYHRAVKRGPFIFVSGTTALIDVKAPLEKDKQQNADEVLQQDSKVHYPTDARLQAKIAMDRCIDAVKQLGGDLGDVVRVKMFVSRHEHCGEVGAAYKECFTPSTSDDPGEIGATATMIVVQDGFVDPDILVEVEVDAIVLDT